MTRLLKRLQYALRARRIESDLAEEIETHRAMTRARLERGGMAPGDANAASRRAMGNMTLAREDARRVWIAPWLESARQDVGYALRMLRRNPGFGAAVILIIAIGIGSTAGVFGLLDGLSLRSLPVKDPERLVWFRFPSFSYPVFQEVRARGSEVLSGLSAWNLERLNVEWGREPEAIDVLLASGEFHPTLGISAVHGRTLDAADDQAGGGPQGPVAVISHASWQRRFGGDPSVVGKTIRIEHVPFTIVGVTPRGFYGVAAGLAPEVTIPLTSILLVMPDESDALTSPTSSFVHLLGRLKDGVEITQANAVLQTFWPVVLESTIGRDMPADRRARYLARTIAMEPGRAGYSRVRNQFEEPLWVLFGLVGLLLAVACASAANLLLARGASRRQEIAVRLAIGAGRGRIVRQLLTESFVWTLLGAGVGVLLASWGRGGLVAMMSTWEEPIALDVGPGWRALLFALVVATIAAAFCAIVPALRASAVDPGGALKATTSLGGTLLRRWSFGKWLVVAQVAVTVLLLSGGALFARSLLHVLSQDAGFRRDNLLVVSTDAIFGGYKDQRLMAYYSQLLDRLSAVPGVEAASLSWKPPISDEDGSWTQSIGIDGGPIEIQPDDTVYFNAVAPGYFDTLGMRLLHGRDVARSDTPGATRVVVVNEALARTYFAGSSPIGRRVTIGRNALRRDLTIVGVVRDAKYQRLTEPTRAIAYLPTAQLSEMMSGENLFAVLRISGRVAPVADVIRREIAALDAGVPVRIATVTERINESLARERVLAVLATGLALAALALACAALYGMLAYAVSRHTKEIGLRVALGAEQRSVLWMVLRESLLLSGIGVAVGLAGALALGRFARGLLFQISPSDPAALGAAALLMLALALAAGFLPARRAARVDPIVALRCE